MIDKSLQTTDNYLLVTKGDRGPYPKAYEGFTGWQGEPLKIIFCLLIHIYIPYKIAF